VISGLYTKGSVKNGKRRFSSHLISDKITMRRYMVLTFTKYTTVMIAELMVMSGLGSSQDIMVWVWLVCVLHV
jgi:hypothetical protein